MDIKYSYLGYSLIFLLVWIVFYVLRPDLRRRILLFSLIIMPLGPLSEFWFLRDYWRRPTITGYPISVEDAIFSSTFSVFLIAVLTWIVPDLLKPSIVSGILVLVLFFLVYKGTQVIFPSAIEYWCTGCNPLGLRLSGINIEELLWDFSWGLAGGTMFEAVTGKKLQKR